MKKKYFLRTLASIAVLFVLLNPTPSDFKSFSGSSGLRTGYYLFFSVYEYGHFTYLGIFKNFFKIDYHSDFRGGGGVRIH